MLAFLPVLLGALQAAQASDFTRGANQEACRKLALTQHLYVNLERLVAAADVHANTCVRTRGRLRLKGREKEQGDARRGAWKLELQDPESGESISLMPRGDPTEEFAERFNGYALSLVGRKLEVGGFFTVGPPHWITFTAYEVIPEGTVRHSGDILTACDVVGSPEAYLGKKVVVWAPFRGRNAFRDLPDETRPEASAWVVGDEDCAVWITGRSPSGEGFSLDAPSSAARWVKVEGTLQRRAEAVVLKASRVLLAKPRD